MSGDLPSDNSPQAAALRLAVAAFSLASVSAMVFAAGLLFKDSQETLAASAAAAALLFGMAAIGAWRPNAVTRGAHWLRGPRASLIGVGAAWAVIMVVTFTTHAGNGWDECTYLLSGLALRGCDTPYAAHRPPVTGLLAALFADVPQALNAVLLAGLLGLMVRWGRRRWGPAAALPLLLLLGQNVFLETLFDVMSELPAALILFGAFGLLAGQRFFAAGIAFGLACLARWNLAVIPLALTALILSRFGVRATMRYVAGGGLMAGLFLGVSLLLVDHPLAMIAENNLLAAYRWAETGAERPDFLVRAGFYVSHFLFLTPPGVLAVCYWLITPGACRAAAGDWCVRVAIPLGIAAYAVVMMNLGGLFPRFMAPIVPLAMFVLADLVLNLGTTLRLTPQPKGVLLLGTACLTLACGLWPGSVVLSIKSNVGFQPVFASSFADEVRNAGDDSEVIQAPAVARLADAGGYPAMYQLRRTLEFPAATRDGTRALVVEPDAGRAVAALLRQAPPGSLVLLPRDTGCVKQGRLLVEGGEWALYRLDNPDR